MRLQVMAVAAFAFACGSAQMSSSDAGTLAGASAGGTSGGGFTAGGAAAGGMAAGGSAGGTNGGGAAGGSTAQNDAGVRVCEPARPTTSCDDEGGPLSGVSGSKGTCIAGGAACQCTPPFEANPVTGRCRAAAERQPVCNRYDGIQCMAVLADGGTRPATGTCGTMTIPAGCGCVYDLGSASYRAACARTCTPTIPGDTDCFTLTCGTIACLDNTRCRAANTCR
ncbi:MAG: hypothetical protein GQE15_32650 [Archangiaceae bacterium]|nr:hypothetical protein [Archangiaceae bacterium]